MLETHSFMDDGRNGGGYPMSRDHGLPDIECKSKSCKANVFGRCISPSLCIIGEDGRCENFRPVAKLM